MASSFQYKKCSFLDNIELFVSEQETEYFPFHLHDYYCISLITKGIEQLQTRERAFFAPTGSISITQANEVHKNSSVDESGYSYKTCYINPELLRFFNDGKGITQLERVIDDAHLFSIINNLFGNEKVSVPDFEIALKKLAGFATNEKSGNSLSFDLIDELIEITPFIPISLDWLSKQFCMSKFHFARVFKNARGISPQAYIMMQRLKKAKKMLLAGEEIKTVAFLNGFYDSTHLNAALKRYFGINAFSLKNSNIIHFNRDG
jgi:AraC-like DNA-binding protein